ncbi:MAG: hypothetical protein Q4B21_06440, partial [Bacteroidia bacterium]|nr:hypothetical protein [Bacteroidia bacterium]
LQLSYTFPAKLIQKSGFMSGLKVYATGRNLLTFTKYDGDPEIDAITSSGDYPNSKQIIFGVEFTF